MVLYKEKQKVCSNGEPKRLLSLIMFFCDYLSSENKSELQCNYPNSRPV